MVANGLAVATVVSTINADRYASLIAFTDKEPKDFMVPSRWGTVSFPVANFTRWTSLTNLPQIDKREDPYAPQQQSGCCTVM